MCAFTTPLLVFLLKGNAGLPSVTYFTYQYKRNAPARTGKGADIEPCPVAAPSLTLLAPVPFA